MAITVDQASNVWTFTAGGATALPYLICPYDLIPDRIVWVSPSATVGDLVLVVDAMGNLVVEFVATTTPYNPVERTPRHKEKYIGFIPAGGTNPGIMLERLDSGVLAIYL